MAFFKKIFTKTSKKEEVYEAVYDYEARENSDLSFNQGEELEIIDRTEGDWWKARIKGTDKEGFVPSNFIKEKAPIIRELPKTKSKKAIENGIFMAIEDYEGVSSEDLCIEKGVKMKILDTSNPDMWIVKILSTGEEGSIPRSMITEIDQLDGHSWYAANISRSDAENVLKMDGRPGTFLVRDGQKKDGSYSLSALSEERDVLHWRLVKKDGSYHLAGDNYFTNIPELISFYLQANAGIRVRLQHPCNQINIKKEQANQWEIKSEQLKMGEELGSGAFGKVYKAKWDDGLTVAVKTMKNPEGMEVKEFLDEADTMKKLRHPRLVRLFGVVTSEQSGKFRELQIVVEYVSNGALKDYLKKKRNKCSSNAQCGEQNWKEQCRMATQIASGMEYLESRKFVHRDLAARNVLVDGNNDMKIADFGLARFINEEVYTKTSSQKVPFKWMAPESLQRQIYTSKSDVWSFGVLLYEISEHGANPYPGVGNGEIASYLKAGKRMDPRPHCHTKAYEIMMLTWLEDPNNRPSFKKIKDKLESYNFAFNFNS